MKSSSFKHLVGLAGFLEHKSPSSCEPTRALVGLSESAPQPDHEPDQNPGAKAANPPGADPIQSHSVASDSRHPLIPREVRGKIERIEAQARALGWPPELLWNGSHYWDLPRGLAAVLDVSDEILEVTADAITILKCRRDRQRFQRYAG
jgi:hypothetical protein